MFGYTMPRFQLLACLALADQADISAVLLVCCVTQLYSVIPQSLRRTRRVNIVPSHMISSSQLLTLGINLHKVIGNKTQRFLIVAALKLIRDELFVLFYSPLCPVILFFHRLAPLYFYRTFVLILFYHIRCPIASTIKNNLERGRRERSGCNRCAPTAEDGRFFNLS
jgi:hypothetical protein